MAKPSTPTPKGDNNTKNNEPSAGGDGKGSDPQKTKPTADNFDVSQLGDEDFSKVFDDPRVWTHPRFKELNDRAKQAKELQAAQAKADEEKLASEKKFEELATKYKTERDDALAKANQRLVEMAIVQSAQKAGAVDTEAVLALIDRGALTPDDNGNIQGVDDAVAKLLESKPFLKASGDNKPTSIGSPTNPGQGSTTTPRFKHSQLQDPEFYREHEAEIQEALKLGLIEDDLN